MKLNGYIVVGIILVAMGILFPGPQYSVFVKMQGTGTRTTLQLYANVPSEKIISGGTSPTDTLNITSGDYVVLTAFLKAYPQYGVPEGTPLAAKSVDFQTLNAQNVWTTVATIDTNIQGLANWSVQQFGILWSSTRYRATFLDLTYVFAESLSNIVTLNIAWLPSQPEEEPELPKTKTLTIAVSGHGITIPAAGTYQLNLSSSIIVLAVPDTGYEFSYWTLDSNDPVSAATQITVTMDSTHLLVAVFVAEETPSTPTPEPNLNPTPEVPITKPIVISGIPINIFFATFGFVFIVLGVVKRKRSFEQ